MAVTSYKISILKYEDCPIKYDDPYLVLYILKCWRNSHVTSETCLKCSNTLSFDLNFTICCDNFYFKPTNEYIVQSIAINTPKHAFLPKNLSDQCKKYNIKTNQEFLVLPDPIYWQITSTLIYELVLKYAIGYVQTKKRKHTVQKKKTPQEDIYMYNKIQRAFLNHGSLSRRTEGKNTYYRKIALAKRMVLTARAMIVPAPFLKPNEIIIPDSMEQQLNLKGNWLILNRMPSLLPENFVGLRVKDSWRHDCLGIPLEIVKLMNADFDGDETTLLFLSNLESVAECQTILNSEENMYSFAMGTKLKPSNDMLIVYHLKYDAIDFLPYKNPDLNVTLKVIYDMYGSKVCFDCIVKLKDYYLQVMQEEMLFCISLEEIQELEKICEGLSYEQFQKVLKDRKTGCLKAQIDANMKSTDYHLYQIVGSVGLQYSKNITFCQNNFITSSFRKGLSPVEVVLHAIVGIDGLISSSGVSYAGYTYFKLMNSLLNWKINYKGEIVDGDTVVAEDYLNMAYYEDLSSKETFQELIRKYLVQSET